MENKSFFFEIDGESFVFCKNQRSSEYSAKHKLMVWELNVGWCTIAYPRNIKEAKKLAKEYLTRN